MFAAVDEAQLQSPFLNSFGCCSSSRCLPPHCRSRTTSFSLCTSKPIRCAYQVAAYQIPIFALVLLLLQLQRSKCNAICAPIQADIPYFVRRKGKTVPAELQPAGEKAHQVDWKQSVLLNLVTQTTYSMTVCACKREHLQSVEVGQCPPQGAVQVCHIQLNMSRYTTLTPSGDSVTFCRHLPDMPSAFMSVAVCACGSIDLAKTTLERESSAKPR